jgi:hypothetical protein
MTTRADALAADIDPSKMTRDQMQAAVMGQPDADRLEGPVRLPPPPPPLPDYQPPALPREPVAELLADSWLAFPPDPDAAAPLAQEELARIQAAVREAVAAARGSNLEAKAQRLAADLATTQAALATAQQAQKDGLKAARKALAEGNDPAEHEQRYRDAALEESILANRVGVLSYLAEEARRAAAAQRRQAAQGVLDKVRHDVPDRRRQKEAEAGQAVKPFLPAILGLHRLETALWDPQTGGLPSWAERMLEGEAPPTEPKAAEPPAAAANDASAKRRERIARVLQRRKEGASLREIAGAEGVSLATIQKDVKDAGLSADDVTTKPETGP